MSGITGVIVALATTATALIGAPRGEPPASPTAAGDVVREIRDGVELGLPDGDVLRVWADVGVWTARLDAETGAWGPSTQVWVPTGATCGDITGRSSAGAVALTAHCSRYNNSGENWWPTPYALWSADTTTWSARRLRWDVPEEPGISPDGLNAVWPGDQEFVQRTPAGFSAHRVGNVTLRETLTATITDAAEVSYLFGDRIAGGGCRLVVVRQSGDVEVARQRLSVPGACLDPDFINIDANTTLMGDASAPALNATISRSDPAAPWALTRRAPKFAPGLEAAYRLRTRFFDSRGVLVAIGSRDGSHVHAQLYDPQAQSWRPAVQTYDAGAARCRWGLNEEDDDMQVLLADIKCDEQHVVLTTSDGATWRALRSGHYVYGMSPDRRYVAVPTRRRTYILSAERGVVTLPYGVRGPCEVVVPDGPDGAVLLSADGHVGGWPTVLRRSTSTGWNRIARTSLPVFSVPCGRVSQYFTRSRYRFILSAVPSDDLPRDYVVSVVEENGRWTARRVPWLNARRPGRITLPGRTE